MHNLSPDLTTGELRRVFESIAPTMSTIIYQDVESGRSLGWGVVESVLSL